MSGLFFSGQYRRWHFQKHQNVHKIWRRSKCPGIGHKIKDRYFGSMTVKLNGMDITSNVVFEPDRLLFKEPIGQGDYIMEIEILYTNLEPMVRI